MAFANVNVISMEREGVQPDQTVVVQGDRIVAVNSAKAPAGATVVDGTGLFLLPGLTDSHVHLTTDMPWAPARADFGEAPLYLAHGVTTVVNLRGTPMQLDWKRRIESGQLLGPTIYTSGEFVNEPDVNTPDEVEREIQAQARAGYDLIKYHEIFRLGEGLVTRRGLSRGSYMRLFDVARTEGVPVVGHVPVNLGLTGLVASSGGAVAHAGEFVRLHFRPPLWVLLVDLAAAALLGLVVAGWGVGALVRRWRRTPDVFPNSLTRIKILTVVLLATFLATFVVGSLSGIGGLFYDSYGWRIVTTSAWLGLALVALLTTLGSAKVWLDTTVPTKARLPVALVGLTGPVLMYTALAYSIPFGWRNTDAGRAHVADQLREAGISVQTTLCVYEIGFGGAGASARVFTDPAFKALLPQTQALWRRLVGRSRSEPGILARMFEVPPRYAEYTRTIARSFHRNGVQLLAGTDAMGAPMLLPGSSLLDELALLQKSGLTPYEALRTATVNPAQFLGKETEFGTIAVGKRADLLLLDGNPLKNLAVLKQPLGVMVRGQWLPHDHLQQLLSSLH
jgi:hypothetical protein